jgi:hypothetical protein
VADQSLQRTQHGAATKLGVVKKLTVAFAMTECRRCTAQRQAQQPCPECGTPPSVPEADQHVQRRRREVAAAMAVIGPDLMGPLPNAVDMFQASDLGGLVDRIWSAARSVAEGRAGGTDELSSVSCEVQRLESWAASVPRLRPLMALTNGMADTVASFRAYLEVVVDALTSETIAEAGARQVAVQEALDAITARVSEFGDVVRDMSAILDAGDPAGALLQLGIRSEWSTIDDRGRRLLESELGRTSETTAYLYAIVGDALARTIGDPVSFWEVVKGHLDLLDAGGTAVTDVMRSPDFARRQGEVAHDTLSSARRAFMVPEAATAREQLTDLLEAGHLVVEQPLKLHLGLACAATTKMSFATTQLADVSELGNIAKDKAWVVASHLPPSEVRNGFAHRSYAIDGDEAVFPGSKPGPTRMSSLALQDAVLRTVEASLAMDLAAAIVAADAEIEIQADLPAIWMAEALMTGLGWTDVSTQICGRTAHSEATLAEDASLAALSFASSPLSAVASELELTLHGPDHLVRFVVPLDMFAAWNQITDEAEKTARYVVLSRSTTRDGSPLITEDAARKVLAWMAAEAAVDQSRPLRPTLDDLRTIRAAARELGFNDLARLLGRLTQWRGALGTDMAIPYEEIAEIFDVMAVPVQPPSQMLLSDPGAD